MKGGEVLTYTQVSPRDMCLKPKVGIRCNVTCQIRKWARKENKEDNRRKIAHLSGKWPNKGRGSFFLSIQSSWMERGKLHPLFDLAKLREKASFLYLVYSIGGGGRPSSIGLFIKWSRTELTRRSDRTGLNRTALNRTWPRPFGLALGPLVFCFWSSVRSGFGPGGPAVGPDRRVRAFFLCFRSRLQCSLLLCLALTLYLCPLRIVSPPHSRSCSRLLSPLLSVSDLLSSPLSAPLSGGTLIFAVGSISFSASPTIVLFSKLVVFRQPGNCFLPSSSRSSVCLSLTVVIFCCSQSSLSLWPCHTN